ncbi:MAG TPA: glycosyltransferase family 2 protein [Gemmatimonadales bacterium]|nr:glycosyltransferase family 2 protein [Gemmatimonadales bacterium]
MDLLGAFLLGLPLLLLLYAYIGYPALLWVFARRRLPAIPDPEVWPELTIVLPVHNESRVVALTLDSLLALDYPADRRSVLVVSDASTDGTDDIVRQYADRGVRLVRLAERRGKTAAENEAGKHVAGDIIVSTDATTRIQDGALKALVKVFADADIGVASGRDVSVAGVGGTDSGAESRYVGYEMWLRELETRFGGIVGASGCFFAIRRDLFTRLFPEALSRDFASPLLAKEFGYRSVSVNEAICYVPRARSLKVEFRRKIRTMARGLDTLWYRRPLINPWKYPRFAFQLLSHKLARWLVFLVAPLGLAGLLLLALGHEWARWLLVVTTLGIGLGALAMVWPEGRRLPRVLAILGFALGSNVAGFIAWVKALRGERNPVWEPTRRG